MRVLLIVPARNEALTLGRWATLAGTMNAADRRLLVVDDHSTDDTMQVARAAGIGQHGVEEGGQTKGLAGRLEDLVGHAGVAPNLDVGLVEPGGGGQLGHVEARFGLTQGCEKSQFLTDADEVNNVKPLDVLPHAGGLLFHCDLAHRCPP